MKKQVVFLLLVIMSFSLIAQNKNYKLLIGTYTDTGKSQGIYSYDVDMKTGAFTQKSVTSKVPNPSFLAITPDKKFVYSVSESPSGSAAFAFKFDPVAEKLTKINSSSTTSDGPCFISATKNHVFTANYGGGSISVFGRNADGSLTDVLQLIQHTGKSVNTERQNEPHVHQVLVSPNQKYVIVNDLGTDKVTVYKYNPDSKTEILTPFDTLSVKPGSGPRHAIFNKDGSKLYLVHEIDGTVSVLGMKNGKLSLVQQTTVAYKADIVNRGAEIFLSPDERFVYVSNRGTANDVTCFAVAKNGKLTFVQRVSTKGDGPRNFALTPDGQYIFVGHQFTDNIVIFKRDTQTGKLTYTDKQIKIGAPVCLLFY
ncbi:MAG: lactonase family protein [Paludibacter sp.]|nr:lactonase family protein [Paludibacter sp.]